MEVIVFGLQFYFILMLQLNFYIQQKLEDLMNKLDYFSFQDLLFIHGSIYYYQAKY